MVENMGFSPISPSDDPEDSKKVLAVILAPGSAEDLIKPIAGHPMLAYSLAVAFQAHSTGSILLAGDSSLAEVVHHYAPIMGWNEENVEIVPLPSYLHTKNALEEYAIELGQHWLSDHPNSSIDRIASLSPDCPLHPHGSLDKAASILRKHGKAGKAVSLIPVGSIHELWTSGKDGLGSRIELSLSQKETEQLYTESGHFTITRLKGESDLTQIVPYPLDRQYAVDGFSVYGRDLAEWLIQFTNLDLVFPGHLPRKFPEKVSLLVMDFDGVLSDNRVWVDENGHEQIAANRSDSLGLAFLRQAGIEALVISMETNPVVTARCRKMKVPALQGIMDKDVVLTRYFVENSINPQEVVYLGNDVNDLPCFSLVGCAVAVADSHPMVLRLADQVLTHHGGHAAVRELCDLLMYRVGFNPAKGKQK
jgi:YrbI family 3-deoxy-D-manno-octulosonate 8-phosphate phosphatase